jgi:hypothetical protein
MEMLVEMTLGQKIRQPNKRLINTMEQMAFCIAEFHSSVILG